MTTLYIIKQNSKNKHYSYRKGREGKKRKTYTYTIALLHSNNTNITNTNKSTLAYTAHGHQCFHLALNRLNGEYQVAQGKNMYRLEVMYIFPPPYCYTREQGCHLGILLISGKSEVPFHGNSHSFSEKDM